MAHRLLLIEQNPPAAEEVDQALGWLLAEGFLLKEYTDGAAHIFSLNPEKTAEAKRFLSNVGGTHRRRLREG